MSNNFLKDVKLCRNPSYKYKQNKKQVDINIMRKRLEDSLVAAHFNHGTHFLADMKVMVIDLISIHDSCLHKY